VNRKKAVTVVIVFLAIVVVVVIVLFSMGLNSPSPQKITVSNLKIDLGSQSANVNYGVNPPVASYTVENLNNVNLTGVSLRIDGAESGQNSLLITPEQSVSINTTLNTEVSGSTTYNIEFVFTFSNETSDTYSTSYTTP
jgi:hypothetical protein